MAPAQCLPRTEACPDGSASIRFPRDEWLHERALRAGERAKAQTELGVDLDSLVVQKNGNRVATPRALLPFFFFNPPKAAPDQYRRRPLTRNLNLHMLATP